MGSIQCPDTAEYELSNASASWAIVHRSNHCPVLNGQDDDDVLQLKIMHSFSSLTILSCVFVLFGYFECVCHSILA